MDSLIALEPTEASHDLQHHIRNALVPVMTATEMLDTYGDRLPPEKQVKMLNRILTGVNQINSFLDNQKAKIEAGDQVLFRAV